MVDRQQGEASARAGDRSDRRAPSAVLGLAMQCCQSVLLLAAPAPSKRVERETRRREPATATVVWTQREVMSLSALSSSSLMALYFIFCA